MEPTEIQQVLAAIDRSDSLVGLKEIQEKTGLGNVVVQLIVRELSNKNLIDDPESDKYYGVTHWGEEIMATRTVAEAGGS